MRKESKKVLSKEAIELKEVVFKIVDNYAEKFAGIQDYIKVYDPKTGMFSITKKTGALEHEYWFSFVDDFYEGKVLVKTAGGYNYFVAETGQLLSASTYEEAGRFSGGLAPVKLRGKWNYITPKGWFLLKNSVDSVEPYDPETDTFTYTDKGVKHVINKFGAEVPKKPIASKPKSDKLGEHGLHLVTQKGRIELMGGLSNAIYATYGYRGGSVADYKAAATDQNGILKVKDQWFMGSNNISLDMLVERFGSRLSREIIEFLGVYAPVTMLDARHLLCAGCGETHVIDLFTGVSVLIPSAEVMEHISGNSNLSTDILDKFNAATNRFRTINDRVEAVLADQQFTR